jgi:phosphoribosylaminoimidazolecarboxamide formyltransferase/IMP cyclohydrolase
MGQVDRVSAARLAIQRAGESLQNTTTAVAGSDAFFPFSDGPALLIDAGITCIVQPGGSVRDQETIDLCNDKNITLLHTNERRFRH